jgi:hypothetical protein
MVRQYFYHQPQTAQSADAEHEDSQQMQVGLHSPTQHSKSEPGVRKSNSVAGNISKATQSQQQQS